MLIKKRIMILLVVILLGITLKCYAADSGTIIGDNVRLREEPSLEAGLVMLLSINDEVEVLSLEGDWYKVNYKDNTGYVFKDYVRVDQVAQEEPAENEIQTTDGNSVDTQENINGNTDTNTADTNTNTTNENNSNNSEEIPVPSEQTIKEDSTVSILPLINSSNIAVLNANTKVTAIEYKNGWVYIVSENASGWIRKEKLQASSTVTTVQENPIEEQVSEEEEQNTNEENAQSQENTQNTSKVGYVNVNSVNVRRGPSTDSDIIDGLVMNDQVTVLGEENGWYKVSVNNIEGYIAKKYISDEEVSVTNRSSSIDRNFNISVNNAILKSEELVDYAKQFLGYKYVTGGRTPSSGFDCSGFTEYVYKNFGYTLSTTSSMQATNGVEVSKEDLKLGDLVFFSYENKRIGHVGIYIGNNNFIHAANESKGVVITSLSNSYYEQNYVTARRIIN